MYSSRSLFLKVRAFVPFFVFFLLLLSTSSKYSRTLISIFTQYVYLNGSDEDGGVVRGKRGTEYGLVVKKCKTCFVIGIHGNNLETRQMLCARGGVRRISHRARHVDVL